MRPRPAGQPLWPLRPIAGESLLGWGARTAHNNLLPSCYTLLRAAGNDYRDLPNGALGRDDTVPDLARVLGADLSEVSTRMLPPSPYPGFVVLGGVAVRRIALVTDKRRFSPKSLSASAHHRQAWMLRIMPFCVESWEYLKDDCSVCGVVQGWLHARNMRRCDRCGSDLTEQQAETVSPELRTDLALLHSLVADGGALEGAREHISPALAPLGPGALLDLACTIAGLIDPEVPHWLGARVNMDHHRRIAAALAQAWKLMEGYPTSVFDGLWNTGRDEEGRRKQRFTRRLSAALRGDDRLSSLPETRVALEQLGDLISGSGADTRNVLVKPAARLLRITEAEVARARDSGDMIVRYGMSNGRVLYGLDEDEVQHLAEVRRNILSPFAVGRRLSLPAYAVHQFVEQESLGSERHPWIVRFHGIPQITEATFASFVHRIRSGASPQQSIRMPVSLARLMRGYGGGPKPWGEVVRLLLLGQIPYHISKNGTDFRDIMVSVDDARRLWSIPPANPDGTYIQFDALDILNHPLKKGSDLQPFSAGGTSNSSWTVNGGHVSRIAADRMSFAELVVRTGLQVATARKVMLLRGADEPTRFGWDRDQMFRVADDLLWSPSA